MPDMVPGFAVGGNVDGSVRNRPEQPGSISEIPRVTPRPWKRGDPACELHAADRAPHAQNLHVGRGISCLPEHGGAGNLRRVAMLAHMKHHNSLPTQGIARTDAWHQPLYLVHQPCERLRACRSVRPVSTRNRHETTENGQAAKQTIHWQEIWRGCGELRGVFYRRFNRCPYFCWTF